MEAYLETLATLDEKIEALDRWTEWYMWDGETEWSEEDERQYNRAVYLGVLYTVQRDGWIDYSPEDLENYRKSAA